MHITTTEVGASGRDYDLSIPRNKCRMQLAHCKGSLSAGRAMSCYRYQHLHDSCVSPVIESAIIDCSPRESGAKPRPTPPQLALDCFVLLAYDAPNAALCCQNYHSRGNASFCVSLTEPNIFGNISHVKMKFSVENDCIFDAPPGNSSMNPEEISSFRFI